MWLLQPLIALAFTTDTQGFYLEPASIHGRLLVSSLSLTSDMPVEGSIRLSTQRLPSLLGKIATCESGGDLHAKNPTSSALGKYQFLNGSWDSYGKELWGSTEGHNIFSEKDQDELALFVYEKYGTTPWLASKDCWGK